MGHAVLLVVWLPGSRVGHLLPVVWRPAGPSLPGLRLPGGSFGKVLSHLWDPARPRRACPRGRAEARHSAVRRRDGFDRARRSAWIRLGAGDEDLSFEVSDDGVGFDSGARGWFFHAFWKVEDQTQRQTQRGSFWRNVVFFAASLMMFGMFVALGPALRFTLTRPLFQF